MGGGLNCKIFHRIISLDNLFFAWREFKRGKSKKFDVQLFEFNLEDNIFELHERLKNRSWKPDAYVSFYIRDPKLRHIHKTSVRDRVLNQAVFRILYQIFDKTFIFDSYSSRINKGIHKGVLRLDTFIRKASSNYHLPIFVLKCDIEKFFDNISHEILFKLIKRKISDKDALQLINLIIKSFEKQPNKGLPLGNVTSQLFANIYLNELDQFVKHRLKVKYYIRYCDDFIILRKDRNYLEQLIKKIDNFLRNNLELNLHPAKIEMRKICQGIDFLGYVTFSYHKVLRTKTKRRMFRKIKIRKIQLDDCVVDSKSFEQSINSYFGVLKHCKGYKIKRKILWIIKNSLRY